MRPAGGTGSRSQRHPPGPDYPARGVAKPRSADVRADGRELGDALDDLVRAAQPDRDGYRRVARRHEQRRMAAGVQSMDAPGLGACDHVDERTVEEHLGTQSRDAERRRHIEHGADVAGRSAVDEPRPVQGDDDLEREVGGDRAQGEERVPGAVGVERAIAGVDLASEAVAEGARP